MTLPSQPTLPAEVPFSEVELSFIEESPAGLWPVNQDSNFGAHRKSLCDVLQLSADQIQQLANNSFIETSDEFLFLWEELVGTSEIPAGKTLNQRRGIVLARFKRGPFTRSLRREVIENVLQAPVPGTVIQLTPSGVELVSGGVPLFAETAISGPFYSITEYIEEFKYRVGLDSEVIYDPEVLTRELERITPAGISFYFGTDYNFTGGAEGDLIGGGPFQNERIFQAVTLMYDIVARINSTRSLVYDILSITPPIPPSSYSVPGGATSVSNTTQLLSALASSPATDIVCQDGTYDHTTYFTNSVGHRVYAANLLGAVFTAGFQGAASNQLYRGLYFNITDSSKTLGSAAINMWGGSDHTVLDCYFDGNFALDWGVKCTSLNGDTYKRLYGQEFKLGAFYLYKNSSTSYGGSTHILDDVSDIDGQDIYSSPRGSSNTYEAVLLIGHPVTADVSRVRARNCGRKCLELFGDAWDTVYSDLDLNPMGGANAMGIGVYIEHYAYYCQFTNFLIVGAERGFNMEWDGGTPGNAGAHHITIDHGIIDADGAGNSVNGRSYGLFMDQGTEDVSIDYVTFIDQNFTAVGYYNPDSGPTIGSNNVYSMQGGASNSHSGSWPSG